MLVGVAWAAEGEPAADDPLSPYKTPFPVLLDRTLGTSSRAVEFDWRRTQAHVAATGTHFFELNNFDSLRAGGLARFPSGGAIVELGLGYVWTWDTPSSEALALTPYRQPGRPDHVEIDLAVGFPLAEGVVTAAPRWFPSVEMVLNGYVGLRYVLYPGGFQGMKVREAAAALFSPTMTEDELDNLEDKRLDAMEVDPGRYGLVVGIGDDLYLKQGIFVSPRAMFGLPVLAPVNGSQLRFWADFSLAVGVAF